MKIILIFFSFLLAVYFHPQLPNLLASHWGINGEVNGYTSKNFGLFFLPILLLGLFFLFKLLPKIDPYKHNFKQFKTHYDNFATIITAFLFYLYCLTIAWNLGFRFSMIQFMSPALAAIFYYAGVLTSVAKRNWFVGIRTPWTMSSEVVWNKTHALGGKLFKLTSLISLLGLIFPQLAIYLILFPVLIITATIFVYSYWEYIHLSKPAV